MRKVILESPYAGDVEGNTRYARECLRDSLLRGEAPIASHLLYTQERVLDDTIPEERRMGIDAGLAWGDSAQASVVYVDRGVSRGMRFGVDRALQEGRPIEFRSLYGGVGSDSGVLEEVLSLVTHVRSSRVLIDGVYVQSLEKA